MSEDSKRVRVAATGEVPAGEGRVVEVGGKSVALFNVDGRYYAIDNVCPHRGGPLGEGYLDGQVVSCPWHAWRFDVATGANVNNPAVKAGCYAVTEEGGGVYVQID